MSLPHNYATPHIPDYHSPRNVLCDQNVSPAYECTCPKPKRARKIVAERRKAKRKGRK